MLTLAVKTAAKLVSATKHVSQVYTCTLDKILSVGFGKPLFKVFHKPTIPIQSLPLQLGYRQVFKIWGLQSSPQSNLGHRRSLAPNRPTNANWINTFCWMTQVWMANEIFLFFIVRFNQWGRAMCWHLSSLNNEHIYGKNRLDRMTMSRSYQYSQFVATILASFSFLNIFIVS